MSAAPPEPALAEAVERERRRLQAEYDRRERQRTADPDADPYAEDNPVELFMRAGRRRRALELLGRRGVLPRPGDPCLEVGYGRRGWLEDLLELGLAPEDLHGIELDPGRAAEARVRFPGADLRVGDATQLPWEDGSFRLTVASTVFTSILDPAVRRVLADEITRVLAPGGALLWYDFRYDNPRNPQVRRVSRRELRALFPSLSGPVAPVTLAPPLARRLVPRSPGLARALEGVPFLRSHLVAVLQKAPSPS